jgi:hypothetical protein
MSAMLKPLMSLASPAFYKAQFAATVKNLHTDLMAGSIMPLYKAIALVGFTGYIVEYSAIGRHHVMHKQAIVAKAMAGAHH